MKLKGFNTPHSIRSPIPLTDDQLFNVVPSIFANEAYSTTSSKYTHIPTIKVVQALRKEGFEPFMAVQAKPKVEDRMGFMRHMLRLRHASQVASQEANEIILINSHDGSSSYQMLAGCFRFVCQNGTVVGDTVEDIRVRHSGDIINNVIEGSYQVLNGFDKVDENRETMKAITLNRDEQIAFAESALTLKFDNVEESPISASQIIRPRRYEDTKSDLWTTFNVVQENLIRGGLRGYNKTTGKRVTTRSVNAITENTKLNQALWTLTSKMCELKAA